MYTCIGNTHGSCKHNHKKLSKAVNCMMNYYYETRDVDNKSYSDRAVVHKDGTVLSPEQQEKVYNLGLDYIVNNSMVTEQ